MDWVLNLAPVMGGLLIMLVAYISVRRIHRPSDK